MVKAVGEAGVDMIKIIVGVIPAEWELNINVNCYRGEFNT